MTDLISEMSLGVSPSILGDADTNALSGRRFSLVPLTPEYHRAIYQISTSDQNSFRWRYHGSMPTYEVFERTLNAGVLCQFVIVPRGTERQALGLVVAYNASMQNRYCYIAAVTDPAAGVGLLEAIAIFIRYLVRHWPFRKYYLEVPEYNLGQYASAMAAGLLKEEGRFIEHQYFLDRYWDLTTYALYKNDLLTFGQAFKSLLESPQGFGSNVTSQ
jgi:hypothetical protein